MNRFDVIEIIGEGTYGIVVKAVNKETKELVAIKKFKENAKNFIKRELKMLNCLKSCEFIVTLKEAYRRKEKIYFIFEYVDRSLLQVLHENPHGLSLNLCKSLLFQLCKAVEKCHSLDIIHRDVKPENLLIDKHFNLKLCDFGFARQTNSSYDHNEPYTEYVATRWYRSPELLLFCPYDKCVDIWAIGCISCEIACGRPVFPGKSDLDQIHQIVQVLGPLPEYQYEQIERNPKFFTLVISKHDRTNSIDRKFSNIMDEKLLEFTKGCLMLHPKNRFNINECLNHSALEQHLKSYINRKRDTQSESKLQQFRTRQTESPSRKKLNFSETLQSRTPLGQISNDEIYLSSTSNMIQQNNEPAKPRLIESRLRTSLYPIANIIQYSLSNEHLNYERNSISELNHLIGSKNNINALEKEQLPNNKFILNQIYQEKQDKYHSNQTMSPSKTIKKKTLANQQFYNDIYNGSCTDLPNIDRNGLVNSVLSTYNNKRSDSRQELGITFPKKLNKPKAKSQTNVKRSKSTLEDYKNDYLRNEKNVSRNSTITPTKNIEILPVCNNNNILTSMSDKNNNEEYVSKKLLTNRKTPDTENKAKKYINTTQPHFRFRSTKLDSNENSNPNDDVVVSPIRLANLKPQPSLYNEQREKYFY